MRKAAFWMLFAYSALTCVVCQGLAMGAILRKAWFSYLNDQALSLIWGFYGAWFLRRLGKRGE